LEETLLDRFSQFDTEGNGFIAGDKLKDLVSSLGKPEKLSQTVSRIERLLMTLVL